MLPAAATIVPIINTSLSNGFIMLAVGKEKTVVGIGVTIVEGNPLVSNGFKVVIPDNLTWCGSVAKLTGPLIMFPPHYEG